MKIVRLNRERDRRSRAERQSVRASFVAEVRDIDTGIDGYAFVAYRRQPDGSIETWAEYGVRDVIDLYGLPDMAREKIRRRIDRSAERVD